MVLTRLDGSEGCSPQSSREAGFHGSMRNWFIELMRIAGGQNADMPFCSEGYLQTPVSEPRRTLLLRVRGPHRHMMPCTLHNHRIRIEPRRNQLASQAARRVSPTMPEQRIAAPRMSLGASKPASDGRVNTRRI